MLLLGSGRAHASVAEHINTRAKKLFETGGASHPAARGGRRGRASIRARKSSIRTSAFFRSHDYPEHRVIGGRFDGGGPIDDLTPLRRKIKKKASRYGRLDKPYVLAMLTAGTFVDESDIEPPTVGRTGRQPTLGRGCPDLFQHRVDVSTRAAVPRRHELRLNRA